MRRRLPVCLALAALLTACSQNDSRLVPLKLDLPADPAQGQAVRVEPVIDARTFELRPPQPDGASLLPDDFGRQAIKDRAIGRVRDGFGHGTGEVLLPEGQTVSALFRDTTIQAFRQAGYRVLSPGEPGYDRAAPVMVTVRQYWNWVKIVDTVHRAACHTEADVQAPFPPFAQALPVAGLAEQKTSPHKPNEPMEGRHDIITDADWHDIAAGCLAAYGDNLKALLVSRQARD